MLRALDTDKATDSDKELAALRLALTKSEGLVQTLRDAHETQLSAMRTLMDDNVRQLQKELAASDANRARLIEETAANRHKWSRDKENYEEVAAAVR